MGKFIIRATDTGFKFDLKAGNGEVIATSEVYESLAACKNGVESVIKNAPVAGVENQTVEGFEAVKHPKFEIYNDKAGEFRFRLRRPTVRSSQFPKATRHLQAVKTVLHPFRRMPLMRRSSTKPYKGRTQHGSGFEEHP